MRSGKKVGALKHVHEENFTVDAKGKDSRMMKNAGASTVVVLSQNELAVIRKVSEEKLRLGEILQLFRNDKVDYVLIEGLYRQFSRKRGIIKILCAQNEDDARRLLRVKPTPVCIVGKIANRSDARSFEGIPLLKLPKDARNLLAYVRGEQRTGSKK